METETADQFRRFREEMEMAAEMAAETASLRYLLSRYSVGRAVD